MTEVTTPKERKPRGEVHVGDVAEFKPGHIVCFCGASSKAGLFHLCDSNGWPVTASERAVIRRKDRKDRPGDPRRKDRPGDLLWDGVSVVCSNCSTIYDSTSGTVTGFGTPPEFTKKPTRKTRRSEEAQRQHLAQRVIDAVKRRLFRREPRAVRGDSPEDGLAAEIDWQTQADAAVADWRARRS